MKKGDARIGIAVYARDEWGILQENSTDLKSESYEEWMEVTERIKKGLREDGCDPIDVPVNVKDIQLYFDEGGLKNNGRDRSRYVALKLKERE